MANVPAAHGIRLCATDLRSAARKAAAIRADDGVPVYLDVEVLIERDTASAFRALAELAEPELEAGAPKPLRYVGTPRGLAGLIADVQRPGIADAVVVVPLGSCRMADLMLDELAPGLSRPL